MGAEARLGLAEALPHAPGAWAVGTFVANVTGCLLIGVLMVLVTERFRAHPLVRPLLARSGGTRRSRPTPSTSWPGSAPGGPAPRCSTSCSPRRSPWWPRRPGSRPRAPWCPVGRGGRDGVVGGARRRGRGPGALPHRPRVPAPAARPVPVGDLRRERRGSPVLGLVSAAAGPSVTALVGVGSRWCADDPQHLRLRDRRPRGSGGRRAGGGVLRPAASRRAWPRRCWAGVVGTAVGR